MVAVLTGEELRKAPWVRLDRGEVVIIVDEQDGDCWAVRWSDLMAAIYQGQVPAEFVDEVGNDCYVVWNDPKFYDGDKEIPSPVKKPIFSV